MGKLMHNTQIKHSSHPHLLQLLSNLHLENQGPINCNGCNLQISPSDHIYACRPCNFFLHTSCSKFPELITHPFHREHALSLLPTSIYPGGFFRCDACTLQGTRFSYHCHICDVDLHVLCASKPLSVNHPFHPHPLVLTFSSPYGENIGFSCDVCHSVGSGDQWLYRCVSCEFDVHLHCATAKVSIPPSHTLQHNHSFPGAAPNQFMAPVAGQPLSYSMSTGHVQTYWQPQNPVRVQSYQGPSQPAMANQNVAAGNGMGGVMVTGFVDGMMQQLGQNFVQTLTGLVFSHKDALIGFIPWNRISSNRLAGLVALIPLFPDRLGVAAATEESFDQRRRPVEVTVSPAEKVYFPSPIQHQLPPHPLVSYTLKGGKMQRRT